MYNELCDLTECRFINFTIYSVLQSTATSQHKYCTPDTVCAGPLAYTSVVSCEYSRIECVLMLINVNADTVY